MAQFSDREGHYEEIIRAMVLQAGMGGLDRWSCCRADSRGTMESLEVLPVAGELSATTVEILNSHGMLTRPLARSPPPPERWVSLFPLLRPPM